MISNCLFSFSLSSFPMNSTSMSPCSFWIAVSISLRFGFNVLDMFLELVFSVVTAFDDIIHFLLSLPLDVGLVFDGMITMINDHALQA